MRTHSATRRMAVRICRMQRPYGKCICARTRPRDALHILQLFTNKPMYVENGRRAAHARNAFPVSRTAPVIAVWMKPGATALKRTPRAREAGSSLDRFTYLRPHSDTHIPNGRSIQELHIGAPARTGGTHMSNRAAHTGNPFRRARTGIRICPTGRPIRGMQIGARARGYAYAQWAAHVYGNVYSDVRARIQELACARHAGIHRRTRAIQQCILR